MPKSPYMTIKCDRCNKAVSSPIPRSTVIRAWVECPECKREAASIVGLSVWRSDTQSIPPGIEFIGRWPRHLIRVARYDVDKGYWCYEANHYTEHPPTCWAVMPK